MREMTCVLAPHTFPVVTFISSLHSILSVLALDLCLFLHVSISQPQSHTQTLVPRGPSSLR